MNWLYSSGETKSGSGVANSVRSTSAKAPSNKEEKKGSHQILNTDDFMIGAESKVIGPLAVMDHLGNGCWGGYFR
jgi:hypothetical protein